MLKRRSSEETLRAAALACWENAGSLSADAKLLADHGYGARAVALAVLALEEFAKAIGYAVAAVSQEPGDVLVRKLKHLTFHEVKHLLAQSSEYAQIVTEDWADGVEWETGFRPSLGQQFAARFCQLARGGLGGLLEEPGEALVQRWHLRVPIASAILTVLYPEDFTVYDVRACNELRGFHALAGRKSAEGLWSGYLEFKAGVERATPPHLSLREKDRFLWARSRHNDLVLGIRRRFGVAE